MKISNKFKRNIPFLVMVFPGVLWLFFMAYLPMTGLIIAFKNLTYTNKGFINSVLSSNWVGLKNFMFLFTSKDAFIITKNTLFYNSIFISSTLVASVFLAILLSYLKSFFLRGLAQSAILFPYFLSWVIVSYFTYAFLSNSSGIINKILISLGINTVNWYSDADKWYFILPIVNLWKNVGYSTVIYLATIMSIDESLYEAAKMDGANTIQKVQYITLPALKSSIIILTILAIGRIFYSDFGLFFQIPKDSGALYPTTNVVDTYVYRSLIGSSNIPMTVAAGLYQSIVGFILVLSTNYAAKKIDKEYGVF